MSAKPTRGPKIVLLGRSPEAWRSVGRVGARSFAIKIHQGQPSISDNGDDDGDEVGYGNWGGIKRVDLVRSSYSPEY